MNQPNSPVSQFLKAADEKFGHRHKKSTIQVKKGAEKAQMTNWSETELFDYFSINESKLDLNGGKQIVSKTWDGSFYTEKQIENLIMKM